MKKMVKKLVEKVKRKPVAIASPATPAIDAGLAAKHSLQIGSTTERDAIKDYVKFTLAQIKKDVEGGSVLPDVRTVLVELIQWIGGREERTDNKLGGL